MMNPETLLYLKILNKIQNNLCGTIITQHHNLLGHIDISTEYEYYFVKQSFWIYF